MRGRPHGHELRVKRRDFIRAGAAGLLMPVAAKAGLVTQAGPRYWAPGSALSDWNARTGGAGVLWAQRFQSSADITRWTYSASSLPSPTLETGGLIPGDSVMRQTVPAGGADGARMWSRPIQPQPGDINQPGLTVGAGANWITSWNSANHGYISAYANANRGRYVLGTDLYFQFRVRFSANRFNAGMSPSKMLYLSCNYQDPTQELILRGKGYGSSVINRAFSVYTNFAGAPNGALGNPQQSSEGTTEQREPGGFPSCTPSATGTCYLWDANVWHSCMVHFRPGTHNVADTLLEIYCAKPGDTAYTLVHQKSDYVWLFSDSIAGSDSSLHGFGINYVSFNPFTGGGGWDATNAEEWYHEFDQIICSLQPIACPQVWT